MLTKRVYNIKSAIEKLKKYCSSAEKCNFDVIQKIKDLGLEDSFQDDILKVLNEEKFVDEERFTRAFCRGKFLIKKWGKIKIRIELTKKNISQTSIKLGFEEINEEEYLQQLNNLLNRKKNSLNEKNIFLKKKKIANYLVTKGYESNLVWSLLSELKE